MELVLAICLTVIGGIYGLLSQERSSVEQGSLCDVAARSESREGVAPPYL